MKKYFRKTKKKSEIFEKNVVFSYFFRYFINMTKKINSPKVQFFLYIKCSQFEQNENSVPFTGGLTFVLKDSKITHFRSLYHIK